jgi:hypothetical protein
MLELEFKNAAMFGLALHLPPFRQLRCLDRHGLDGTNELPGKCRIDAATGNQPALLIRGIG